MPSPDLTGYTELTLYDKGPYELMSKAIQEASVKMATWSPRVGSIDYVILEALALMVSEEIYAINRLPNAIMEITMALFGIERDLGAAPQASATFTVSDTAGHEIPIGTLVRLDQEGTDSVEFATDDGLAIAAGDTTGTVTITATSNTTSANNATIGTPLVPVSTVAFVDSIALASSPAGGADAETDDEWRDRATIRFGRFTDTLVQAKHFTARALEDPSVNRAFTKDNWNVSTSSTGHVTIAVADIDGEELTGGQKTTLQTELSAQAMAGLGVHVVDPTYTTVNVTATVTRLAGAVNADVETAAEAALAAYLSPKEWPWSGVVRLNEIISLLDQVEGVDWVGTVLLDSGGTPTAANVSLSGDFPLVRAGTMAVTVSSP